MERSAALAALPPAYAQALRLREAGLADAEVARRLGRDEDLIGPLFELATAKLEALLAAPGAED